MYDSLSILLIRCPLLKRNSGQKENDQRGEDRRQNCDPFEAADHVQRDEEDAPPDDDLAEVVRVARQTPQTCGNATNL